MMRIVVAVLLALSGLVLFAPEKLYLLLGKDATLTGRTFIWDGISRVMACGRGCGRVEPGWLTSHSGLHHR